MQNQIILVAVKTEIVKRNKKAHEQFCKHALNMDWDNIYSATVIHLHIHNSRLKAAFKSTNKHR